jgi:hypothetical protein
VLFVNEKIKIRKDLQADKKYDDIYCHNEMLKFKGKEVTIGYFPYLGIGDDVFYIKEDPEGYLWSGDMLEKR